MIDNKTDILLARYFAGEATEQELQLLDGWLAESDEHEAYFDQLTMLYQQTGLTDKEVGWDTKEALSEFKDYIQEDKTVVQKKRYKLPVLYKAVAASLILLVGLFSFYLLYNSNQTELIQITAENAAEKHQLFENAEVLLEPNSQIEFLADKQNEIKLQGKATFIVQGEQDRKLLVQAGNTFIRDIGTVFTVDAQNAEAVITVEVAEGEVIFYTDDNEGVRVKENEKATYNTLTKKFNHITMEETDDEITFVSSRLSEVMQLLAERYNTNIALADKSLEKMQISVTFDKDESIDTILEIITETLNLKLSKEKNSFIISY